MAILGRMILAAAAAVACMHVWKDMQRHTLLLAEAWLRVATVGGRAGAGFVHAGPQGSQ